MTTISNNHFQVYQQQYQFLEQLSNVSLNFQAVKDEKTHPLEQVYLHHIFKQLQSYSKFDQYQFYIISANTPWNYKFDKKSVVFYMSNEDHKIPDCLKDSFAVFTPYCPTDKNRPRYVFPIPLGYNGAIPNKQVVDIMDRPKDLFFSGNLHRKRLLFYSGIQKMRLSNWFTTKKQTQFIHFSRKFTAGLSPKEYANHLMHSKIALVPSGYLSKNSFRFFEAMRYGCIVITEELYDYWFYKNFPGVQLKHWWSLDKQIRSLLNAPTLMEHIQGQSLRYYEEYCSETAVANYIIEQLEQLESLQI